MASSTARPRNATSVTSSEMPISLCASASHPEQDDAGEHGERRCARGCSSRPMRGEFVARVFGGAGRVRDLRRQHAVDAVRHDDARNEARRQAGEQPAGPGDRHVGRTAPRARRPGRCWPARSGTSRRPPRCPGKAGHQKAAEPVRACRPGLRVVELGDAARNRQDDAAASRSDRRDARRQRHVGHQQRVRHAERAPAEAAHEQQRDAAGEPGVAAGRGR